MNIPELLGKIREINKELIRLKKRNEHLEATATNGTSRLSAIRYGGTEHRCKHEDAVLDTWANDDDAILLQKRMDVLRADLRPLVAMMPPGTERRVTHMRYMEGWSCARIARRTGYCDRQIYRFLDKATETLQRIEDAREKMSHHVT